MFKISKADERKAEMMKTTVTSPIWLGCIVTEYKKDLDKNKANLHKYTMVVQTVDNPEHDAYAGMHLFTQFSEKNLGFMSPFCAATGCPKDEATDEFVFASFQDFKGKRLDVYVIPVRNTETGKDRNQVEDFRPWSWSEEPAA